MASHLTQRLCAFVCMCVKELSWEGEQSNDKASYVNMLHMWLWYWSAVVVRITPCPFSPHPIHPHWMWLSIHVAFTEEGGEGGGKRRHGVSEGERWSFSSSWLWEKKKKTIGVQMDASLLNSWKTHPSLPPSIPSLHPSFLQSWGV